VRRRIICCIRIIRNDRVEKYDLVMGSYFLCFVKQDTSVFEVGSAYKHEKSKKSWE